MTPRGRLFFMKPFVPLWFAFLAVLAACETTRAPTPAELFAGQAIISVHAATEPPPPESYHRQMLETPLDVEHNLCQVATTDEVVAAVNDIVRQAKPLPRDAKVLPEDFVFSPDYTYPAGSPLFDLVGTLLIDSKGRSVTLGNFIDWDGNRHILTDAEHQEVERIIDYDSIYRQCTAQTHEWRR
jgi:hypothetical protein